MDVTGRKLLQDFCAKYRDAEKPLTRWYKVANEAEWSNPAEVRKTFRDADSVKVISGSTVTVFNIGGNKYRLIARVRCDLQKVIVIDILTHAEYSKDTWKGKL